MNEFAIVGLDAALDPLDRVAPLLGVAAVSALIAIGMLLVFKATSNQKRIADAKQQIAAHLFELRLFSHDPRLILKAQGEILRYTTIYLGLSLVPLLWAVVPLAFITSHLQARYGYEGLAPGEQTLLKVQVRPGFEDRARAIALEAPPGLRVETSALWIPVRHEVVWRIGTTMEGDYVVHVTLDDARVRKTVTVSDRPGRRSPVRPEGGVYRQLLHPSEPPVPAGGAVGAISLTYAEGALVRWPVAVHWSIALAIFSILFAQALKQRFHVIL